MKKLNDILIGIKTIKIIGNTSIYISNIQFDSRKVVGDSVFVAIPGTQIDGHVYIQKSIEAGAKAIICEVLPQNSDPDICWVIAADSAEALGIVASNYYDCPSQKLKLVGVTGTNGKTTVATLLFRLFRALGFKCGLISTVTYSIEDKTYESTHTTPDQLVLNNLMNKMIRNKCEYCFMEVSSHSLSQKRTAGLKFTGAIFTNITHDHLDYHLTFENYIKAKKSFFDKLQPGAFALINSDDKNGTVMVQNTNAKIKTYAMRRVADFKVKVIESHFDGMQLLLNGKEFWTPLIGEFNAYNLLAVYGASIMLDQDNNEVLRLLSTLREVRGRFETLRSKTGIIAIIDYAHTPDALVNVLKTIQQIRKGGEQLITVVGAGGNRDKKKRPIMALVCAENSDKVIFTSDNPRFEEPEIIIQDMVEGLNERLKTKMLRITDRREAIKTAFLMAKPGDILLIAGKGHETYQEIKGIKHHFDDKEEVLKLM